MADETKTEIHINKTEEASSYEFGKAGNRHKIYYNEPKDLKRKIEELKALGIVVDEVSV